MKFGDFLCQSKLHERYSILREGGRFYSQYKLSRSPSTDRSVKRFDYFRNKFIEEYRSFLCAKDFYSSDPVTGPNPPIPYVDSRTIHGPDNIAMFERATSPFKYLTHPEKIIIARDLIYDVR